MGWQTDATSAVTLRLGDVSMTEEDVEAALKKAFGSNNRFVGCGFNNFTRPVEPLGWVGGFGGTKYIWGRRGSVPVPPLRGCRLRCLLDPICVYVQFFIYIYI